MVDADDKPLNGLDDSVRVHLWHPISADAAKVLAWRRWLERHEIVQPFKQAHREVYILTDAERRTADHSNRFAAHIIRQHQFAALCRQRGWRYRLQGSAWDGANTPTLELPDWDLRVEFWVQGAETPADDQTSHMGVSLFLTTDQVRFTRADLTPVPLTEVPALVFSEVMRDADLFVGVTSIGNDPRWEEERYEGYWHSFSFGELSVPAQTRREVLLRLIPRLKIAERCTILDKFLVVRGNQRNYKIHLGSGNILMEPNDQYLCIVPAQGSIAKGEIRNVFLPFEGDFTLSHILSKAFLLAEDHKITDPSIRSQIDRM
jgi:hypothetical protein